MNGARPSYDDFTIDLQENALDSLVHAIEHYQLFTEDYKVRNLKYTVLHAFHAVELLLESRLAREHPLLIFDRPEEKKRVRTATFDQIVDRLDNCGVELKWQRQHLDSLRGVRNSIEHHQIDASQSEVENYVGKAIYFLDAFLNTEFTTDLRTELEDRLLDSDKAYTIVIDRLYDFKARLEAVNRIIAQTIQDSRRSFEREICPHCGEQTLLLPDPRPINDTPRCYFCSHAPAIYECEMCGGNIIFDEPPSDEFDMEYCENCQEHIFNLD